MDNTLHLHRQVLKIPNGTVAKTGTKDIKSNSGGLEGVLSGGGDSVRLVVSIAVIGDLDNDWGTLI